MIICMIHSFKTRSSNCSEFYRKPSWNFWSPTATLAVYFRRELPKTRKSFTWKRKSADFVCNTVEEIGIAISSRRMQYGGRNRYCNLPRRRAHDRSLPQAFFRNPANPFCGDCLSISGPLWRVIIVVKRRAHRQPYITGYDAFSML